MAGHIHKIQPGDPCPWCEKPVEEIIIVAKKDSSLRKRRETLAKVRAGGGKIGAPFKYTKYHFLKFKEAGYSMRKVARIVKCAPSTVKRYFDAGDQ